jgi:hypothetical protein
MKKNERGGKRENVCVCEKFKIGMAKRKEREEGVCGSKIEREKGVEKRREGNYVSVW